MTDEETRETKGLIPSAYNIYVDVESQFADSDGGIDSSGTAIKYT